MSGRVHAGRGAAAPVSPEVAAPWCPRALPLATVAALVLILSGCLSRPVRAPDAAVLTGAALAAAGARVEAREARLRAAGRLVFNGRVALTNGRDGGSGRIEWSQADGDYRVVLSAPVTRQSWSLSGGPGRARIDGLEGGPRAGTDPERLLFEATGIEMPVGAMLAWAAGTRADPDGYGRARLHFDADGRLLRLEQGGWTIDYQAWQPDVAAGSMPGAGEAALPERITARRGDARVRLIVDDWALEPASAADG